MTDNIKSDFEKLEQEIRLRFTDKRKAATMQKNAAKWFANTARYGIAGNNSVSGNPEITPADLMRGKQGIRGEPVCGQIFSYFYDPKHKDTLPYYDLFPLVMPFEIKEDSSWLGINLHYLPPHLRARLLGLIRATMRSTKMSREAKAQITYKMIKTMSRFKIAQPAIKHYLESHVKSRVIRISPIDWHHVVMLPNMEQFVKQSKEQVWRDTLKIIRNNR